MPTEPEFERLIRAVTVLLDEAMAEAPDGGWWQAAREPGEVLVRVVATKLKRMRRTNRFAGRIRRGEVILALRMAYSQRAEALFGQSTGLS